MIPFFSLLQQHYCAVIIMALAAFLLETATPGVYNSAVKIYSGMKLVMQESSYLSPNVRKLYLYIFLKLF